MMEISSAQFMSGLPAVDTENEINITYLHIVVLFVVRYQSNILIICINRTEGSYTIAADGALTISGNNHNASINNCHIA